MILDKIDGFAALEHYGIAVARNKQVNSAEDAIAFAARRTSQDTRPLPTVLRIVRAGGQTSPMVAAASWLADDAAIRHAYHQLALEAGRSGGYVLAQEAVEGGTDLVVEGRRDVELGKVIAVRSDRHEVRRMVPLGDAGAEALVAEFRAYHHHPADAKTQSMLAHFLSRVSHFFEESGVEIFELNPVRLHGNVAAVLDATLSAPHALHVSKRLNHGERPT